MKIIHLGAVPPPEELIKRHHVRKVHPGRWVLEHAIAQKNAGFDVEVVTNFRGSPPDFTCNIDGVTVHFLHTRLPYRHLLFYAADPFLMARYVRWLKPDVVHAHGTEAAYALAAIRSKLPFCVTAQGLMFQIIPTLKPSLHLNERFIRISENWAWKHTKFAIVKSEYVREALEGKYPHLDISPILNTYSLNLDCVSLPEKSGLKMAFVGTIDERKGVHVIAEAMEKISKDFPDAELHMAGNAPEGMGAKYEREQIARLRGIMGSRLVLHGRLAQRELLDMLDACSIMLAPSLEEMFGNQMIEGLMRGCHAIVTDGTALAENVRRFGNGTIIPQKDPNALARAVKAAFDSPPPQNAAEAARKKIRSYMEPKHIAELHGRLYARIISSAHIA